jgi:hypothetical protein
MPPLSVESTGVLDERLGRLGAARGVFRCRSPRCSLEANGAAPPRIPGRFVQATGSVSIFCWCARQGISAEEARVVRAVVGLPLRSRTTSGALSVAATALSPLDHRPGHDPGIREPRTAIRVRVVDVVPDRQALNLAKSSSPRLSAASASSSSPYSHSDSARTSRRKLIRKFSGTGRPKTSRVATLLRRGSTTAGQYRCSAPSGAAIGRVAVVDEMRAWRAVPPAEVTTLEAWEPIVRRYRAHTWRRTPRQSD